MRFLIVGVALLLAPAAPAMTAPAFRSVADAATRCPDGFNRARGSQKATVNKLADLPPANAYLAVYRRGADGCVEPVIAGYGYGSTAKRQSATPKRR